MSIVLLKSTSLKRKLIIQYLISSAIALLTGSVFAQSPSSFSVSDGPYLFWQDSLLKARWIRNNILKERIITEENYAVTSKILKIKCTFSDLVNDPPADVVFSQKFIGVDSLAVIADVHGEYKKFARLLIANGITDKNLNWSFGKGHLVVLGDILDRGWEVTDILWTLFTLEKQASSSGGMVHVLLGNHEFMELNGDNAFLNDKYRKVEEILGITYSDIFSERSVLGRWLRSKPVVISINRMVFTHGGLSDELVRMEMTIEKINTIYFNLINGKTIPESDLVSAGFLKNSSDSPLWYRGYFTDKSFNEGRLKSILDFYGMDKIVVGHTTFGEMISLYGSKLIGADAGIMNKTPGEMLIYSKGIFYRGLKNGRQLWFTYAP